MTNDADEVAYKLNEVIELLWKSGFKIEKLCSHWQGDFNDYHEWYCTECGVILENSDD